MNYKKKIEKLEKKILKQKDNIKSWNKVFPDVASLKPKCKGCDKCKDCIDKAFCADIDTEITAINLEKAKSEFMIKKYENKIAIYKFKYITKQR